MNKRIVKSYKQKLARKEVWTIKHGAPLCFDGIKQQSFLTFTLLAK